MQDKKLSECPIPDSPHMRAVGLLIRNMRRHHALVERRTCDLGIHHSQHRMLIALAKLQDNVPSQKELAEILGISAAAVTATVATLRAEGKSVSAQRAIPEKLRYAALCDLRKEATR